MNFTEYPRFLMPANTRCDARLFLQSVKAFERRYVSNVLRSACGSFIL